MKIEHFGRVLRAHAGAGLARASASASASASIWASAKTAANFVANTIGVRVATAAIAAGLALAPMPGLAQLAGAARPHVIVISNDRGGLVRARAAEIDRIAAAHQRVEIRGRVCLSSCTMYLGLADTCISPATSFGFHGPSFYGAKLSVRDFEYWSRVIASHYPEPLRAWYMRTGRTRISSYFRVSGRELIRMGIRQC